MHIGIHATVANGVTLPETAQLGQKPPSTLNPEFTVPIRVLSARQVFVFGPIGSRLAHVTVIYGQGEDKRQVYVYTGCFGGTLDDFKTAVVTRKQEADPHRHEYEAVITLLYALIQSRQAPHGPLTPGDPEWDDWG